MVDRNTFIREAANWVINRGRKWIGNGGWQFMPFIRKSLMLRLELAASEKHVTPDRGRWYDALDEWLTEHLRQPGAGEE